MSNAVITISVDDLLKLREIICHAGCTSTDEELRQMQTVKIFTAIDMVFRFAKEIKQVSSNRNAPIKLTSLADPKFRQELFKEYRTIVYGTDKFADDEVEGEDDKELAPS